MTIIVLILKVDKLEAVNQFRPIGLCNVVYKNISKIFTNRIKGLMIRCISQQQRGFIAGKLIHDNIIVDHEAFHDLKGRTNCKTIKFAMKADMGKAYDHIEWDFLYAMLIRIGFDLKWVEWIMKYVSFVEFELIMSDKSIDKFKPQKGVRQGDPLSPFLFIIAVDVLSQMVSYHIEKGDLKGIRLAKRYPVLSHLFFMDDSLFFMKAEKDNCVILKKIIDVYYAVYGQQITLEKSCLFFSSNADSDLREEISTILQILDVDQPGKYLGLPMI